MPSILIIEKNCDIKSLKLKTFVEEDLYKKCNFKSSQGFSKKTSWQVVNSSEQYTIELYGKTEGRSNHENKYEFPPPVDNTLFFGSCILVKRNQSGDVVDITIKDWEKYYSQFYGGFVDVCSENSSSDDDDDSDGVPLTKDGYKKDGFVVDDEVTSSASAAPLAKVKRGRKKAGATAAADETATPKKTRKPRKTAAEISATVAASEIETSIKNVVENVAETTDIGVSIYDDEPELTEEEYV